MRDLYRIATVFLAAVSAIAVPTSAQAQQLTESDAVARALADNARLGRIRAPHSPAWRPRNAVFKD